MTSMNSGGSLRDQNKVRRHAGVGLSPTPLTKSVRTRLWKRLRGLDRKVAQLDYAIWIGSYLRTHKENLKFKERRDKEDAKRRSVRRKLKGYD